MINEYISEINAKMKASLKESRYEHSLGVAFTAFYLATVHGYSDPEKAFLTGLIHDMAKAVDYDCQLSECEKRGIELTEIERRKPGALCHSKLGAYMAEHDLGIDDTEILNAIKYHTSGRPDMTMLEEIIYISDFVEPGRRFEPELLNRLRIEATADLKSVIFIISDELIKYLGENETDPITLKVREYYRQFVKE